MLRLIHRDCDLDEDVTGPRFETETKYSVTNTEQLVFLDFVYYESIKRELKTKLIYECRCDETLKTKVEESTRLCVAKIQGQQS